MLRNPRTSQLYTAALDRGEGVLAEAGAARRRHRPLHRPLAEGQVHRPRARLRGPDLVERHRTPRSRRSTSTGCAARSSRSLEQRDVYVIDAFCGADPKHRLAVRVLTTHPYHALFAKTMFIEPDRRRARRLRAGRARPPRARGRGRPGAGRHAHRGLRLPPPESRRGDPDRRHVLRRRDQEVRLHADERPAAARGRHADALLRERLARTARTSRSSSASPAPARRRSRPIPSGC